LSRPSPASVRAAHRKRSRSGATLTLRNGRAAGRLVGWAGDALRALNVTYKVDDSSNAIGRRYARCAAVHAPSVLCAARTR